MKVKVPATINVTALIDGLKLSPTQFFNLKNKIYYFLSCVVADNNNYKLNSKNNGYRNISSALMKKLLGNKDYYTILQRLTDAADPIIESDNSYHHPQSGKSKGYCKGYRLAPKYNTGEVVYKTLPQKFSDKLNRHGIKKNVSAAEKYSFLSEQFNIHHLSFSPEIYEYIYSFAAELLRRIENNNPYQTNLILNHIGRWLYYIEQIESGEFWMKVSEDNHRFNSSITNLPKLLRPFLRCNSKQLTNVDISSSQPYVLASVMDDKFFTDTTINDYNLHNIYPELYNDLVLKAYIKTTINNKINNSRNDNINSNNIGTNKSKINQFNYISDSSSINKSIDYITTYTGNTEYTIYTDTGSFPFMWCEKFTVNEKKSICLYQQAPFQGDYYTHVIESFFDKATQPKNVDVSLLRTELKQSNMYVLFESNFGHRNHNPSIKMFNIVYPGVNKWIEQALKVIGSSRFAYLLQRAESYLLLNVVCREFNQLFPAAPLFTIHDGIYTYGEYVQNLTSLILKRCKEITGIDVGFKVKVEQCQQKPSTQEIDKVWKDFKDVITEKKYNKICGGVFSSNIKRCSEFLDNFRSNDIN